MQTHKRLSNPSVLLTVVCLCAISLSAQSTNPKFRRPGFPSGGATENATVPPTTQAWTLLFPNYDPVTIPNYLGGQVAAYDSATNSLIAFGGQDDTGMLNAVMALSNANGSATGTWTIVLPSGAAGSPSARDFDTGVYDSANSRLIVFGGCGFSGLYCTAVQNDVWVLSNANSVNGTPTWTQLTPSGTLPPARWGHAAAYDPINNRMVIYGGDNLNVTFGDTWVLSNANGLGGTPAWTKLIPTGAPDGQDDPTVVYDSAHNVMILFGGRRANFGQDVNSVWTLSNANGMGGTPAWTKLIATGTVGSPPRRDSHFAAYDGSNNRMIIFGGNSNTSTGFPELNDTWVLANASGFGGTPQWTKLRPSGPTPDRRTAPVGGYDLVNNRFIMCSGFSFEALFYSAWVLSGANGL
ncbi:MAG TPA: kelch repeat-containing protein [Candidatus Sulfotelmatobacter sp.]|nr:kelch repeat-containing protein [Candidatus Sulfotelmatobacter sp.]